MRIALLGGTGDIGEGLALRWAHDTDHEVLIGSRDPERAREAAERYDEELADRGVEADVSGFANPMAADRADVIVLAVPAEYAVDTVEAVADRLDDDDVLVSPAVPMRRAEAGFKYEPPAAGSTTEAVAAAAPEGVPVVGAFHNLAAGRLAHLDAPLGVDVLVVADDGDAAATVSRLAEEIEGLRALDGGGLAAAAEVETVTPLLVTVAVRNEGLHDLGVRFD
ncbi:MAG: NADPH-dependent F420 reductase [Halobacteriales archaeon]|nr:NADPH-dependent F420 reductase [Halobacteriales archaeon]